jgi:acyl carrier protein
MAAMDISEIEQIIVQTLQELQAGSGDGNCEIIPAVVPLLELGFFDSLLAIETTIVLEERLGCSCGDDSVFKDKGTEQPLTIAQIASRLALRMAA